MALSLFGERSAAIKKLFAIATKIDLNNLKNDRQILNSSYLCYAGQWQT